VPRVRTRRASNDLGRERISNLAQDAALSTELDSIYDRQVDLPHDHQWFAYAVNSLHGDLWGYGSIGEGGPKEPAQAVQATLLAMELSFADFPLEARRKVFAELQKCQTRPEVEAREKELFGQRKSLIHPTTTSANPSSHE
jgi:hypothetical protein